jgi:hypothetical protein
LFSTPFSHLKKIDPRIAGLGIIYISNLLRTMGIPQLNSYISSKFKPGVTTLVKGQLICIDGNSLAYWLQRFCMCRYHGDYHYYDLVVQLFVEMLERAGLNIATFFDGIESNNFKKECKRKRTQHGQRCWHKYYAMILDGSVYRDHELPIPLGIVQQLKASLTRLSVNIVYCKGEADRHIARYAKENYGIVLGLDSDYYFYPVPYLPLNEFTLPWTGQASGKVNFPDHLENALGLDRTLLTQLALNLGNDYLSKRTGFDGIDSAVEFLKSGSDSDSSNDSEAMKYSRDMYNLSWIGDGSGTTLPYKTSSQDKAGSLQDILDTMQLNNQDAEDFERLFQVIHSNLIGQPFQIHNNLIDRPYPQNSTLNAWEKLQMLKVEYQRFYQDVPAVPVKQGKLAKQLQKQVVSRGLEPKDFFHGPMFSKIYYERNPIVTKKVKQCKKSLQSFANKIKMLVINRRGSSVVLFENKVKAGAVHKELVLLGLNAELNLGHIFKKAPKRAKKVVLATHKSFASASKYYPEHLFPTIVIADASPKQYGRRVVDLTLRPTEKTVYGLDETVSVLPPMKYMIEALKESGNNGLGKEGTTQQVTLACFLIKKFQTKTTVFVSSTKEMEWIRNDLEKNKGTITYKTHFLHNQVPFDQQVEIYRTQTPNAVDIILTTNANERGLSVPGTKMVIDFGTGRIKNAGDKKVQKVWITAGQSSSRAKNVDAFGQVFRLYQF